MIRFLAILSAMLLASSARAQPVFSRAGDVTTRNLTAQTIGDAATVDGTALSTIAAQAGAALPTAALPSAQFRGSFEDAARGLADRVSDHLNVKAFGARGDGVSDDTSAFQEAADVATGRVDATIGSALRSYLTSLTGFLGVGPRSNGAVEIDIPAGHYVLSRPIAVSYQPNSALHWKGDGSSMTELEFRGGVDGLVTTFSTANAAYGNDLARTGSWKGQGIEVDGIHFIANTGIVPAAAANQTNIGAGQGEAGRAIATIGLPLINASMPPFQIYRDLLFSNSGGWNDAANNWKNALYLQDPDNLFVEKVAFIDHSLDTNRTSVPIWIHSTAPANGPGHGFLNLDYPLLFGGGTACIQIDGNAIQGINITHAATVGCQDGITWLANPNSLSGSLVLADGSLGADRYILRVANASTIYSHDNFFYNVAPPKNTNPIFFYVGGGDTLVSHHDQFMGPVAGYMGSGYSSTAMFVTGVQNVFTAPSHISDDVIAHFDSGLLFGGGSTINFTNDVVGPDTTTCYRDTSASTTQNQRGQFDGITCGPTVNTHDGIGFSIDQDWVPQRYMNGGIELGLPGVASPGGVTGYGGNIDFHSLASSNGATSGLNDYDARLIGRGGVAGQSGQGFLDVYAAGGLNMASGPITGTTLQMSGRVTMGAGTTTGNLNVGQYLVLGTATMANLASGCGAGGMIYVSDGRKTGEAAGAGSGVPAICLPSAKGGATAWYAVQPSTLSN